MSKEIIEPHMSILLVSHEIPFIEKLPHVFFFARGQIEVDLAKDAFFAHEKINASISSYLRLHK